MAQANGKTKRRTVLQVVIAAVLVLTFALAAWYLTSERFGNVVRGRVVAALERSTGGRVELKSLRWNLGKLEIEARDLTIHGLEPRGEVPYVHVERLYARLKIISLLRQQLGLENVSLDSPVIHFIVNPDGTTNVPTPKAKSKSGNNPVQPLFDLAIGRTEVNNGMLLWNQRRIPLNTAVNDLSAALGYDAAARRYDGVVHLGKIETAFQSLRPFSSVADIEFSLFADHAIVKALKVSSGRTQMDSSGTVSNFNDPKIEIAYKASVDLGDVGSIARVHELRRGTLELNGQGTYSLKAFSASGKLLAKNGSYEVDGFHVSDVSGGADYSVSPDRITLPHLYARAFGGNVRGEVELRDWMPSGVQFVAQKAEQAGVANLRLTNVPVGQIAAALSSKKLPLNRLNLAGTRMPRMGTSHS